MKVLVCVLILVSFLVGISKSASCSDYDGNESGCTADNQCLYDTTDSKCKCFSSSTLDVLFVVDASNSISDTPDPNDPNWVSEWQLELDFIKYGIDSGISDNSRVGIIKFNSAVEYLFEFTSDRAAAIQFIDNGGMGNAETNTHTRDAINEAINVFSNNDIGNERILVLITDGNPSNNQNPTIPTNLKDNLDLMGVTSIGILIGPDLDRTQLELLFDDPQKEIYEVSDFDQLNLARSFLELYTCTGGIPFCGCSTDTNSNISARRRMLARRLMNRNKIQE